MNSVKSLIIYTFFIIGVVIVIDAIMKSRNKSATIDASNKEALTINKLPEEGAREVVEPQVVSSPPVIQTVQPTESSSFFSNVSDSFEPLSVAHDTLGMTSDHAKYFSTIDNPVKPDTAPYQFYEEPIENKMQSARIQAGREIGVVVKAPQDPEVIAGVQPFSSDSSFAFV